MKKLFVPLLFPLFIFFACNKPETVTKPPKPTAKDTVYAQVKTYEDKIPVVYINTLGNTIVNEPKVRSELTLKVGDTIPLKANIGIEYRGSSSLYFEQKSFGFEFWDAAGESVDTSIMDLPKADDFIFYAPANDKSLLRNVLLYELSNDIGMYATRTRWVQLYLNGSYNGLYVLMEKIKRNKARVNISKAGSDVSGGYIIKIDKSSGDGPIGSPDTYYDATFSWRSKYDTGGVALSSQPFGTKKGIETYFLFEYPKAEDITGAQKDYLIKYFNDFEDALLSENYKDPYIGYRAYIDVPSFVDFFLLNEISHNPDAHRLSTFMNKEKGGKLKLGPVWDFNIAFGNDSRTSISAPYNWAFNFNHYYKNDNWLINFWWKRLLSDPYFTQQIKQRWQALRSTAFAESNMLSIIDKHISLLQKHNAVNQHFSRWKFLGVKLPFNGFVGQTYDEEVNYLKQWVRDRLMWMDQNISKL